MCVHLFFSWIWWHLKEVATGGVHEKKCSWHLFKLDRKIMPLLKQAWNFIKKENFLKETVLRKRLIFTKFSWNIFFIEHFQAPALLLLLESPIFWVVLFSSLSDVYLLVFCFTLHMLLFYLLSDFLKFIYYVYLLNKLPPSFLFWINELM